MSQSPLEQTEMPGVETIGEILRKARKDKGLTPSQAAQNTRMKVQHIEAIEKNSFGTFAAPAYAKGFIKIYAESLGLDSSPLIQKYTEQHAPKERAPLLQENQKSERSRPVRDPIRIDWSKVRIPAAAPRVAGYVCGIILVVAISGTLLARCRGGDAEAPVVASETSPARQDRPLALVEEPPAPYMDWEYTSR